MLVSSFADYWCRVIGVSSFFAEKRTDTNDPSDTNNPSIFPGKNDELPSREGAPGGLDRASGFPFPL